MVAVIWLSALVVLLVIEAATMGLTTIWFAGGALVAFLAALLGAPIWIQAALFVVISLVLLIFTRPAAVRLMEHSKTQTNVDSIPGRMGIVTEDIENLAAKGSVQVDGMEWSARTEQPEDKISRGEEVIVLRVEGVKLIVERKR